MTIAESLIVSAKLIGAGLATIGVVGAGIGIGVLFGAFLLSISRNPVMEQGYLKYIWIAFGLTEAMGLLGIMMAFLILYS